MATVLLTTTAHVRLTENDVVALFRSNVVNNSSAVWLWLTSRFGSGWALDAIPRAEIMESLGLPRSSYYAAIAALRKIGALIKTATGWRIFKAPVTAEEAIAAEAESLPEPPASLPVESEAIAPEPEPEPVVPQTPPPTPAIAQRRPPTLQELMQAQMRAVQLQQGGAQAHPDQAGVGLAIAAYNAAIERAGLTRFAPCAAIASQNRIDSCVQKRLDMGLATWEEFAEAIAAAMEHVAHKVKTNPNDFFGRATSQFEFEFWLRGGNLERDSELGRLQIAERRRLEAIAANQDTPDAIAAELRTKLNRCFQYLKSSVARSQGLDQLKSILSNERYAIALETVDLTRFRQHPDCLDLMAAYDQKVTP